MLDAISATLSLLVAIAVGVLWISVATRRQGFSNAAQAGVWFRQKTMVSALVGVIGASIFGGAIATGAMAPPASTLRWLAFAFGMVSIAAAYGLHRESWSPAFRCSDRSAPRDELHAATRAIIIAVVLAVFGLGFAIYQIVGASSAP